MADARERILDAAMELIAQRGYAATTTKAIADAAGVNEVTLFRHFKTKAGVLEAIGALFAAQPKPSDIDPDVADVRGALAQAARDEIAGATRLGAVGLRLAFDARDNADVAAAFATADGPAATTQRMARFFAHLQADGRVRDDVEPALMAEAFSSLTSSFVMARMVMGVDLPDDSPAVDSLVAIFCDGIHLTSKE